LGVGLETRFCGLGLDLAWVLFMRDRYRRIFNDRVG